MLTITNQGLSDYNNGATERRFSPYSDNGGSVVAIAGEDFCVIASDTRLSGHGYAILSREQPKLFKLSETTILGSTGCRCDILTFCKVYTLFTFNLRNLWKQKILKLKHRLLKCV